MNNTIRNVCFGPQVIQNKTIQQFQATKKKRFNLYFASHFVSCLYEGELRGHFGFFHSDLFASDVLIH